MFGLIDFGLGFFLFILCVGFLLSKVSEAAKTDAGKTAISGLLERFLKK